MRKKITERIEQFAIAGYLIKWFCLVIPVAIVTGSLVALFLWLLDLAISTRWNNHWLLFFLPVAGVLIYFLYKLLGKNAAGGNNLLLDEIDKPAHTVPLRMAPLVLITTVITHLFGGSAGREGTAVQMGGSIAACLAKIAGLKEKDIRIVLMAGIAAGFGAVFGTPVTGAVFALEVIAIGSIRYDALLPCLLSGILADITCTAWGIQHTAYYIHYTFKGQEFFSFFHIDPVLLIKVMLAGILFGLTAYLFSITTDAIKTYSSKCFKNGWTVPVAGGLLVIALMFILGTEDYLSLGVTNPGNGASIVNAFHAGGVTNFSWLWKLLFTVITIGTGFKGGEVTPLFFIGAALGNSIAIHTGMPIDLIAGLGFIAVFAGATNTPLACSIMGVELFGGENIVYYAVACFTAYYFSGHTGIYGSQRLTVPKHDMVNVESKEKLKDL